MRDILQARPGRGRLFAVLATAAAVLAAGGGAYAATSSSTQRQSAAGQRASAQVSGPLATTSGTGFVAGAAVVSSSGHVVRGLGVKSANEVGFGEYQVLFNRKVNRCAYEATLGSTGTGAAPDGQIGVATRGGHKNGVWIVTWDSSGNFLPQPFHLIVIC
jgi:hypothetical protein